MEICNSPYRRILGRFCDDPFTDIDATHDIDFAQPPDFQLLGYKSKAGKVV
jgi:hypothetical protein